MLFQSAARGTAQNDLRQRQIEQLCTATFNLLQRGTPHKERLSYSYDKIPRADYLLIFADYKNNKALMATKEITVGPSYWGDNTPMVTITDIPQDVLKEWGENQDRIWELPKSF